MLHYQVDEIKSLIYWKSRPIPSLVAAWSRILASHSVAVDSGGRTWNGGREGVIN